VELVTHEKNAFFLKQSLARRRRSLRDFPVVFLRVLVCLKWVFLDRPDVEYDCDITSHPHLLHGTNSHEHATHRDNRVNQTWKSRGRSTQLTVTDMSRLTYCLQIVAEKPPTPHCCGVEGFSATICRQYVRRDMSVTVNCVLLPLHFHV